MKKTLMIMLVLIFGISFMGISSAIADDCNSCSPCCPHGEGTGTPGYWKNKGLDSWTDETIYICDQGLNQGEVMEYMTTPIRGNKWLTLFKAYVAAKLNVVVNENCEPKCCTPWGGKNLTSAEEWLCLNKFEVAASSSAWQEGGEAIYLCLDDYNNGILTNIAISRDAME